MFNKYNKYIIFILITFFVFTQYPIIETMDNSVVTDIVSKKNDIENKIKNFEKIKRNCNLDNSCNTKLSELETLLKEIQSEIYDFSDKIQTLNGSITNQHNTFNSKIDQNNELKNQNKKLLTRIEKLEDKEDSSYGMIESYKKKYFSTIVELVMIILCVLFLMILLYTEMSKK
jgi:chromosome segregation ATPase